jgi:hypothetical protein
MADSCRAALLVARQLSLMVPPKSAPPAPQPSHHATQLGAQKIEKEKMLNSELFLPSNKLLTKERDYCAGALFILNNIARPKISISRGERDGNFRQIVEAKWVR